MGFRSESFVYNKDSLAGLSGEWNSKAGSDEVEALLVKAGQPARMFEEVPRG
jgi:hypothetical protein